MTSTSQADPAKAGSGSEPESNPAEAKKDSRQVPLDALAEARQKARAAEEERDQLKTRLAALEQSEAGKASAQPQPEVSQLAKQLAELQHEGRLRKLTQELGLSDEKQADAVSKIIAKSGDLTPAEALEIASKRQPDLFKDRGSQGFDPRTHGSLRPTSGLQPEPKQSDKQKRLDAIKNASGTDQKALLDNYVGRIAARAMGWEKDHKFLPIPERQ